MSDVTTSTGEQKTGPSRAWYAVAVVLVVMSVVSAVGIGILSFVNVSDDIDAMPRIDAPGRATVTLDKGKTTVFAEYSYDYYGYYDDFDSMPIVRITSVASGDEVVVVGNRFYESYDFGNRHGRSIGTVDVPSSGRYEVTVGGESSRFSGVESVAIGSVDIGALVAGIFAGIALGGLLAVLGLIIVIVVAVKRSGARKANRPVPAFAGGYGPPPSASYPPPAYPPPASPAASYPPPAYPPPAYPAASYPPPASPQPPPMPPNPDQPAPLQ